MNNTWHDIYVGFLDPSEYKAAMALAGSWANWKKVREKHAATIDLWAEEVEAILTSQAIDAMKEHAKLPGGTAASKWLAEKTYKGAKGVGRPKLDKPVVEASSASDKVAEDVKRLFVVGKK
jgi:hypothetical protein